MIVILGGIFMRFDGWEIVGGLIWLVAAANVFFLLYSMRKWHELKLIQEEHMHMAEIMKLDESKRKTRVVIEKTDLTGFMHQTFSDLKIAPAQVKDFAYGVLVDERPMTIREWTPLKRGKTFSDPQWRRLMEFMQSPDWDDKRVKFAVPINPKNENDGFELTAAGKKWLEDVLSDTVLTSVSS